MPIRSYALLYIVSTHALNSGAGGQMEKSSSYQTSVSAERGLAELGLAGRGPAGRGLAARGAAAPSSADSSASILSCRARRLTPTTSGSTALSRSTGSV